MIASYYFVMCDNCSDCDPVEMGRNTKKQAIEAYIEEEGTTRYYGKHFCSQECKDEFMEKYPRSSSVTQESINSAALKTVENLLPEDIK